MDREVGRRLQVVGEVELDKLFNDGARGTGTAADMALRERNTLAQDGIVVVAVDVGRAMPGGLARARDDPSGAFAAARLICKARVTARGMWTDNGALLKRVHRETLGACEGMPPDIRCAAAAAPMRARRRGRDVTAVWYACASCTFAAIRRRSVYCGFRADSRVSFSFTCRAPSLRALRLVACVCEVVRSVSADHRASVLRASELLGFYIWGGCSGDVCDGAHAWWSAGGTAPHAGASRHVSWSGVLGGQPRVRGGQRWGRR